MTDPPKARLGIVLSGWAPAMTLMSGAMRGFREARIEFEVVSTSGVGGFIGLLSLAPKGKTPDEALRDLPNLFVSDLLHKLVPLNFKIFHKYGPFAQASYELRRKLPKIEVPADVASPLARFANDWLDLVVTTLTPMTLESYRDALMSQVSMIEDCVDFARLKAPQFKPRFYLNAFDLAAKGQMIFRNRDIGANAYRAAQAMFLLFSPHQAGGRLLTTGATHDPTGLQAIWLYERNNLDMVIALDPMSPAIWREPRNINDAFQLMLLNPIVALQVLMLGLYAEVESTDNTGQSTGPLPRLYRIPFDGPCEIPPPYYPEMLEWTHANAVTLDRIGYCAARQFASVFHNRFNDPDALEQGYRYARRVEPRSQRLLGMFRELHLFDWKDQFLKENGNGRPRPNKHPDSPKER